MKYNNQSLYSINQVLILNYEIYEIKQIRLINRVQKLIFIFHILKLEFD